MKEELGISGQPLLPATKDSKLGRMMVAHFLKAHGA